MRVAYILDRFPAISETFISDEVYSVLNAGVPCRVFALTKSQSAVVHPRAQRVIDSGEVVYPAPRTLMLDFLGLLGHATRNPGRAAKALAVVLIDKQQRWLARIAIGVASDARKLGATHLHAHYADTAAQVAMWVHRWTGIPFTLTTHRYDIFEQPPSNMKELVDEAQGMVCISHYNADFLVRTFGIDKRKLKVIRCGIYFEEFENETRVPENKDGPVRLLCVARLMPEKGHQYLFEAVRMLIAQGISVKLTVAGEGSIRQELERLSIDLGIQSHVNFLGEQTGSQVRQLFMDCDIGVLASVSESMGLVNMEGMASGRPVIATSVLGVPELVEDRVTGFLCPPRDPKAIAETIHWILQHPADTRLVVERGKTRVKMEFSRTECTRQLIGAWARWDS